MVAIRQFQHARGDAFGSTCGTSASQRRRRAGHQRTEPRSRQSRCTAARRLPPGMRTGPRGRRRTGQPRGHAYHPSVLLLWASWCCFRLDEYESEGKPTLPRCTAAKNYLRRKRARFQSELFNSAGRRRSRQIVVRNGTVWRCAQVFNNSFHNNATNRELHPHAPHRHVGPMAARQGTSCKSRNRPCPDREHSQQTLLCFFIRHTTSLPTFTTSLGVFAHVLRLFRSSRCGGRTK